MRKTSVLSLAAALATVALFADTASARILVDFGATDVAGTTTATTATPIYNVSTPPAGQPTEGLSWNCWNVLAFGGVAANSGIADLVDTTNASTGIGLTISAGANSGTNGLTAASGGYPFRAVSDYFYPSAAATPFTFTLSNLEPGAQYDITLFVGRGGAAASSAGTSRAAIYTVTGSGTPVVSPNLEAALGTNTAVVWTANDVVPSATNTITIQVATGTWFDGTTDVTSGGGLLGGMDIVVPEPASLGLLSFAGLALLRRRNHA